MLWVALISFSIAAGCIWLSRVIVMRDQSSFIEGLEKWGAGIALIFIAGFFLCLAILAFLLHIFGLLGTAVVIFGLMIIMLIMIQRSVPA